MAFRVGITRDNLKQDGTPIFDPAAFEILESAGVEWEFMEESGPEVSAAAAAKYDAFAVMMPKVTRATVSGADRRVKLVARFGVGYDTVDVPACSQNGVALTIAPDGVRRPVASSVATFVLMLAHKVPTKDRLVREGRWQERTAHFGTGLSGRTLGSIGVGNIGAEVFRLMMPWAMRHIACDPYVTQAAVAPLGVKLVDIETLFRESDFLAVNCPLNDETRKLVDARLFGLMKPTAYFINTARGPIVDEAALIDTLSHRRIAGAGIDVFEIEPASADHPLMKLDNVVVTPHHICLTDECINTVTASVFNACRDVALGRVPRNVVNQDVIGRLTATHR
ncbi:MAG: hypothetical protein KIT73_15825 [Burkholderiales bacterium]|nr:hypothetical protein [Burkholderiales bacterium]